MKQMDYLFSPKSVAIIGASRNPKKVGHVILRNFIEGSFTGKVYPINPKTKAMFELKSYPSVLKVPGRIDLAVISVPAPLVPRILDECGRKNVKAVIIIAGGFGEVGNNALEEDCFKIIKKYGMRTIGPNCISGDTSIIVKNSNRLKYKEIGEFVDSVINNNKEQSLRITDTIVAPVNKIIKISSWDGRKVVYRRIRTVMRKQLKGGAIRVKLSGGRKITCSPDHPFIIKKGSETEKIPSNKLRIGHEAMVINSYNEVGDISENINLVNEFIQKTNPEQRKNIVVNFNKKRYSLDEFKAMGLENKKAVIRTKHGRVGLPSILPISESLCRILGFFIADGNYKKDFIHIGYIKNKDEERRLRNDVNKVFVNSSLKNESTYKEIKFGRMIGQLLFKQVFGIPQGAQTKCVPNFIFSSKKKMIIQFLSGLFSGDGTIYKYKNNYSATIYLSSISRKLIDQTQQLLSIIGIGPFYIVRKKRTTATIKGKHCNARDLYYLRSDSKQAINDLWLLGFRFLSDYKNNKLRTIIQSRKRKNFGKRIKSSTEFKRIIDLKKIEEPVNVYDFEVERTHNFFANGILTSNCIGVFDPRSGVDTFFLPRYKLERPKAGSISFISQSGALGSVVLDWMAMKGYTISKFISYGNAVDVDEADLTEYLASDPTTSVICCYFEGLKEGRKFYNTLKKVSRKKPVIIIKGGMTEQGTSAVSSHTGSLAGSKEVHAAAFSQAGGIQAQTLEELFDFARVLANQPVPKGNRVQIITDGGGFGVLTTDWIIENGLAMADMDNKAKRALRKAFPPHVVIKNPLDLTGDATVERYHLAMDAAIKDPNVDMIAVIALFQIPTLTADIVDVISAAADKSKKPLIVIAAGGRFTEVLKKTLEDSGVPTFSYPEKAASALKALYDFGGKP